MTLKYMQGFETMRDDSDFRAQNWVNGPTARRVAITPGITNIPGTGLTIVGAHTAGNSAAVGVAGSADPGYYNTGVTVNQAWTAGGLTMGCSAKFNSTVAASYGAGIQTTSSLLNNNAICFDGTRYWAVKAVASTYNIVYSTDLLNWTTTAAQPSNASDSVTGIFYLGAGVIAITRQTTVTGTATVWYTSNLGASWATQGLPGAIQSGPTNGSAIATGNATYPHAIFMGSGFNNGGSGALWVGTLGGTMTLVASYTGSGNGWITNSIRPRIIGTLVVIPASVNGTSTFYSATASNASLNTAGAWSTGTASTVSPVAMDIAYNATSNLWVVATAQGMYTFPNSGVAGTPVAPSGSLVLTARYTTVGMTNVFNVGSTMVAVGSQGHIITSPDGVAWTETGGHILGQGTSGQNWQSVINDGSRYILCSDATSGVIATSPDLQTNYAATYVMDNTEATGGIYSRLGVWGCSGAFGSTFTLSANGTNNGQGFGLVAGAVSGNNRPVTFWQGLNTGTAFDPITTNVLSTAGNLTHYYEIKLTKDAATVNNFFMSMYVDGTLIATSPSSYQFGNSTADTTSLIILALPRSGQWTEFDDIYFTLDDGVAGTSQGPLGIVNIVVQRPETDVSVQWVKAGGAASNSLSVNQLAISSSSANSVSSNNAGDKDTYGTTDTLPAGYTPKAVQVEAYFTKTSTTAPVVNVGLLSGGAETDSANATISGASATYVSQIVEKNPNGSVAWVASTVNAADFVINHVT